MKNKQTPSEILQKHEDANEMHFHEVDRKFIIEAMEEYAKEKSEIPIISDEQIDSYVKSTGYYGHCTPEYHEGIEEGAKWYREQLKSK